MTAQITAFPTPPSTNDPSNFNTRADAFLGQMPTFVTEANALANEVSASAAQTAADRVQTGLDRAVSVTALSSPGTNGSSATSLTVGTGTKAFTTQTGKAWAPGQGFFLASTASPLNWMSGILTAYNTTSGAATLEVDTIGGSGTFAAWNCGLAAGRPMTVATQVQAEAGTDATTVMTPQRAAQSALVFGTPMGGVLQSSINPGSRWLPCTGLNYLNTAYPVLSPSMAAYPNPMTLRQAATTTDRIVCTGGVFLTWMANGTSWAPYTSPDGVTWTARTSPLGTGSPPPYLAAGGGVFIASNGASIYTSPDGATWTLRSFPFQSMYSLDWAAGAFTVSCNANDAWSVYRSSNGISWSDAGDNQNAYTFSKMCFGLNWIGIINSSIYYSSDLVNWTGSYLGSSLVDFAWGAGRFVVVSNSGIIYYSSNGASFSTASTSLAVSAWKGIIYDGARFIACGANGALATSVDGVSGWTMLASGAGATTVTGVARASSAAASPIVIAAAGVRSGLDASSTQFVTPSITPAATGLGVYIKAS